MTLGTAEATEATHSKPQETVGHTDNSEKNKRITFADLFTAPGPSHKSSEVSDPKASPMIHTRNLRPR